MKFFFTAFTALYQQSPICDKPLGALAGMSYVWMVFIYGAIPLVGLLLHDKVKPQPVFIRLIIYLAIIYAIEFVSGYLLKVITGKCPWQYTTGHHIMGLIQLDYAPGWMFFAWVTEKVYVFMNTRVIK